MKIPKLNSLKQNDPEIFSFIDNESIRQNEKLELIASENFVSRDILEAVGSILTNKYAEGYPGKRYYGGCEWVDKAENLAIERGKKLFVQCIDSIVPLAGCRFSSITSYTEYQSSKTSLMYQNPFLKVKHQNMSCIDADSDHPRVSRKRLPKSTKVAYTVILGDIRTRPTAHPLSKQLVLSVLSISGSKIC